MLVYLIALAIGGLITGALARLALPGPDPMSLLQTMLVGIGGSFIAGLIFYGSYASRIERLSGPDLSAIATKYLDPQQSVIVVVGDRRVIEPGLRALNLPLVVVDENGAPVAG